MKDKRLNIIFLDMDGVLNNSNFIKKWKSKHKEKESFSKFKEQYCLNPEGPVCFYYIVPQLINRFHFLYNQIPNCKVVWSSSWRNSTKKDSKLFIESLYYQCGLPNESFLGYTPSIPYLLRKDEIERWIEIFKDTYKIRKIAIIDDLIEADPMRDEYFDIPIKFFKTSMKTGLTKKITNEIIKYFNEEN